MNTFEAKLDTIGEYIGLSFAIAATVALTAFTGWALVSIIASYL